ncbi:hypothetical protein GOP47_0028080 [Adiantum capillus-veneris]|nr:hypothetical protein GOP47_0028080 [Adiantum capillus-veneris]
MEQRGQLPELRGRGAGPEGLQLEIPLPSIQGKIPVQILVKEMRMSEGEATSPYNGSKRNVSGTVKHPKRRAGEKSASSTDEGD